MMSEGILVASIAAAAVIVAPVLTDALRSRREARAERDKAREDAAKAAKEAHDAALEELRTERNWWRDRALRLGVESSNREERR